VAFRIRNTEVSSKKGRNLKPKRKGSAANGNVMIICGGYKSKVNEAGV